MKTALPLLMLHRQPALLEDRRQFRANPRVFRSQVVVKSYSPPLSGLHSVVFRLPAPQVPRLKPSDRLLPTGRAQPVPTHRPPKQLLMLEVVKLVMKPLANRQAVLLTPVSARLGERGLPTSLPFTLARESSVAK